MVDFYFDNVVTDRENYWAWDGFGAGKNVAYLLGIGAISLILLIFREAQIKQKIQLAFGRMCCYRKKPESPFSVGLELKDSDVNAESRRVTHSTLSTLAFTDPLVFRFGGYFIRKLSGCLANSN